MAWVFLYPIIAAYSVLNTKCSHGQSDIASAADRHPAFVFSTIVREDNRQRALLRILLCSEWLVDSMSSHTPENTWKANQHAGGKPNGTVQTPSMDPGERISKTLPAIWRYSSLEYATTSQSVTTANNLPPAQQVNQLVNQADASASIMQHATKTGKRRTNGGSPSHQKKWRKTTNELKPVCVAKASY